MSGRTRATALLAVLSLALVLAPAIPAAAAVFTDGFESGTTSGWTKVTGSVSVQTSAAPFAPAPEGSRFVYLHSTGSATFLQRDIATQADAFVDFRVFVNSASGGMTLVTLTDDKGKQIASLKMTKTRTLSLKNQAAGGSTSTSTKLPTGWVEVQVHLRTGSGSLGDVFLGGATTPLLHTSTSFGSNPVGRVLIGTKGSSKGFDAAYDAVTVDTTFIGAPPAPPADPTNLREVTHGTTTATIAWDAVPGATAYGVYRDGTKLGGDVTGTTFADAGLAPGVAYAYTVDATDGALRSNAAGPLTVTTADGTSVPDAPTLQEDGHTDTTASFHWDPVPGADSYDVSRDGAPPANVTVTSFADSALAPATPFSYTVTAVNVAGSSSPSSPLVITTDPAPVGPDTPANLHATSVGSTTVALAWDPVAGATAYGVYRGGTKVGGDVTAPSFSETSLTPATAYGYTVDATDGALRSSPSAALPVTTAAADPVVMAAGDIACDPNDGNFDGSNPKYCQFRDTASLLGPADEVLAIGDTQYYCGGTDAYAASYGPSWGTYLGKTFAVPADQEYATAAAEPTGTDCSTTANAAGYYAYFGVAGGAGASVPGAHSTDIGGWHIVGLNSVCAAIGGCAHGDPEDDWLRADLGASSADCTIALLHLPRFVSRSTGNKTNKTMQSLWETMYDGGVDIVLSGNSHLYERFAPQDVSGKADPRGIVEMIVGMGGRGHGGLAAPGSRFANSVAGQDTSFGVMRLTLHAGSYDFAFLTAPGEPSYTDAGSNTCRNDRHL
jgi:hypothetical protein